MNNAGPAKRCESCGWVTCPGTCEGDSIVARILAEAETFAAERGASARVCCCTETESCSLCCEERCGYCDGTKGDHTLHCEAGLPAYLAEAVS